MAAKGGKQAPTQATFGGSIFRNMVNVVDKNVPTSWSVEEGKFENVKWVAELGNNTHGTLVVYGGRVFIGTNNFKPRDPKIKGDKAILMCFAEKDGDFLWQNVHDMPPPDSHDATSSTACAPRPRSRAISSTTARLPACSFAPDRRRQDRLAAGYDEGTESRASLCLRLFAPGRGRHGVRRDRQRQG